MKLTPEQFAARLQRIHKNNEVAFKKAFEVLGIQKKVESNMELIQPIIQKALKRAGIVPPTSPEEESLEDIQKCQATIVEVLDSLKAKLHPMFIFGLTLQGEISMFLKSDLEASDIEAFKSKFNQLLEAHIEIELIEPSALDNLKSVFNGLLGIILTIATLGLVFAVNKGWACSFFSSPETIEIRHDALEGKYKSEFNNKLRDEVVEMAISEEEATPLSVGAG